jgi:PAS domain S-box-containing protein
MSKSQPTTIGRITPLLLSRHQFDSLNSNSQNIIYDKRTNRVTLTDHTAVDVLCIITPYGMPLPAFGNEGIAMSESSLSPSMNATPRITRLLDWARYSLPEGRPLPDELWRRRHRGIVILLWLHALGLVCFGLIMEAGLVHSLMEGSLVALAAAFASLGNLPRRVRASVACLGLITASGVLVHLSGGYIEMHFHFFVIVIVISLYEDWVPFLLTIGYVVAHHGTMGVLYPTAVYNHPDAWAHPWKWAAIHGVFVLAASIASLVNWRLTEAARAQSDLLLHSAGEGIYGIDRAGKTAFVNPATAAMLGWPQEQMMGRPVHELLRLAQPDGTPAGVEAAIARALGEGVAQPRSTTVFARKDGTTFPTEYVCMPMCERGQIIGAVITFQDISARQQEQAEKLAYLEERKSAQEHIIQQQAQIENLSVPLIPIADQVILMPLIGLIDTQRGEQVITMLLQGIEANRAQVAILDVSGASVIDTPAANALLRAAHAVRLLGAELVLTGIRPEVAQSLVALGIDLQGIVTESTVQGGVTYALNHRRVYD